LRSQYQRIGHFRFEFGDDGVKFESGAAKSCAIEEALKDMAGHTEEEEYFEFCKGVNEIEESIIEIV
jgi:hypothetical protein